MIRTVLFVVFALLASIPRVATAHPDTPVEVSLGEAPWRTFGGQLLESSSAHSSKHLLTVPAGQEFIVTTVRSQGNFVFLHGPTLSDEMFGHDFFQQDHGSGLTRGNGRLRILPGQDLFIRNWTGSQTDYLVEGYFVTAGSPYRSAYSMVSIPLDAGTHAVLSASEGRDFLVTMVLLTSTSCDVLVDGELKIPGNVSATTRNGDDRLGSYWAGKGRLVVPAGGALQIHVNGGTCGYYVQGHYIGR